MKDHDVLLKIVDGLIEGLKKLSNTDLNIIRKAVPVLSKIIEHANAPLMIMVM